MAQKGKPTTITNIVPSELGSLSGSGGLIGSVIEGYEYNPIRDEVNLEETIQCIVIDKVRTFSNLPNRTTSDGVNNATHVIDTYIALAPIDQTTSILGEEYDLTAASPVMRLVYIPSHLVTSITALPGVECCDDTGTADTETPIDTAIEMEIIESEVSFPVVVL